MPSVTVAIFPPHSGSTKSKNPKVIMDASDRSAFSRPADAVGIDGQQGSNNKNKTDSMDRDSPTGTSEFPSTPSNRKSFFAAKPASVTPSPTSYKTGSDGDNKKQAASTKKDDEMPSTAAPMTIAAVVTANSRVKSSASANNIGRGANDEKTRARQERMAALAQQQRRNPPASDLGSSRHGLVPPRRMNSHVSVVSGHSRMSAASGHSRGSVRGGATKAGVVAAGAMAAAAATNTGSSINTEEDPDILAKRQGRAASGMGISRISSHKKPMLPSVNYKADEDPDVLAKRQGRATAGMGVSRSSSHKKPMMPTAAVRKTMKEDPDVIAKRQGRAQSGAGIRRSSHRQVTAAISGSSKTLEKDIIAKRQGRAPPLSDRNVRKLQPPPITALTRRTTTASSVSTNSSTATTVTQNTMARAAEAQVRAINLVLESDDDEDDDDHSKDKSKSTAMRDTEAKRLARASCNAPGMKRVSTAQIQAVNLVLESDDEDDTGSKSSSRTMSDVEAKRRAQSGRGIPATAKQPPPRRGSTVAAADAAVKRSASMTPEEIAQRATRRQQRTMGSVHSSAGSNGSWGSRSTAASASFHSTTRARRSSKKEAKSDDDCDDEDAVQAHLSHIASTQAYDQAMTTPFASAKSDHSEEQEESSMKMAAARRKSNGSMRGSAKMNPNSVVDHIILEEDFADTDSFADADPDEAYVGEAEAGVPIGVQVGAFAVAGLAGSTDNDADEPFDSDINFNDDGLNRDTSVAFSQSSHHDPTLTDPNSALFFDEELALEATLFNNEQPTLEAHLHEVVDAMPLSEDPSGLSAKALRRLRLMQCTVFCLAVGAIAAVIGVALSRPDSFGYTPVFIPTIEGWDQIGSNMTGPIDTDTSLYGFSIASTSQLDRIAIGVPGRSQSPTELLVGEVHIMDWNGTQWLPNGVPILGPGPDGQAGTAVAMSKDGKRIAVGSPYFENGGHVAVYEESKAGWVMIGQALTGYAAKESDERFGGSLAMSADGKVLAVGAPMGEGPDSTDSGYVKVFRLKATPSAQEEWFQVGETIHGENSGDFFGWSLAMSASGTRIVAGSIGSTADDIGEFAGQVRAFDFNEEDSSWVQSGQSIQGLASFDSFGSSVAMSASGDTLAAGAIGHSNLSKGVDIGHVRVFRFDGASWQQLGQTLVGQSAFDSFGYSVSLSEEGKTIAAGGPRNDEFAESSGQIQIYDLSEDTSSWTRQGSNIGGSYTGSDLFGWSVVLSGNGTRVAGGAPFSTFDERLTDVGTVRVYDLA